MDKLRAIEVYVRIVERGSLTAASEALGLSVPTVVRSLASLEKRLGVRLLNRTTRRLHLTEEGREYYDHCKRLLADIDTAEAALTEARATPAGRIVVTAPVPFGRWHVAPLIAEFLAKHPKVRVDLLLLDRVVDLVEEGVDLAVRLGDLDDSSLVAVQVGHTRFTVSASPGYLEAHGKPTRPDALASRPCVNLMGRGGSYDEWTFIVEGRIRRVRVSGPLTSNQLEAVIDGCLRGLGCGRFYEYQVREHVKRGRLRYVLESFAPPPVPIHVVYPHARLLSARVRSLVDWLVPRLRTELKGAGATR